MPKSWNVLNLWPVGMGCPSFSHSTSRLGSSAGLSLASRWALWPSEAEYLALNWVWNLGGPACWAILEASASSEKGGIYRVTHQVVFYVLFKIY